MIVMKIHKCNRLNCSVYWGRTIMGAEIERRALELNIMSVQKLKNLQNDM